MFTKVGLLGSAGITVALMVGVSIIPTSSYDGTVKPGGQEQ